MKRLISFMLVLTLVLTCAGVALAASPKITQQPVTQTVKAGGKVTFTVKAKNAESITWYFTNPETGETTTGRKLSSVVKGVKVVHPNSLSITLKKVPEEMHGWTLYCHIGPKNSGVNSDEVMILIAGKEVPETAKTTTKKTSSSDDSDKDSDKDSDETAAEPTATPVPEPKDITIKASKVQLFAVNDGMEPQGSAVEKLTFEGGKAASFYVSLPEETEGYIEYLSLGSIRLTPAGDIRGMAIKGWTDSCTVKVKVRTQTQAEAEAEAATLCKVTCENCRFTGYKSSYAASGSVPAGTTITVAASGGLIAEGYSINGAEATHQNETTFQLVIDGDTTITMEAQKGLETNSDPLSGD